MAELPRVRAEQGGLAKSMDLTTVGLSLSPGPELWGRVTWRE